MINWVMSREGRVGGFIVWKSSHRGNDQRDRIVWPKKRGWRMEG